MGRGLTEARVGLSELRSLLTAEEAGSFHEVRHRLERQGVARPPVHDAGCRSGPSESAKSDVIAADRHVGVDPGAAACALRSRQSQRTSAAAAPAPAVDAGPASWACLPPEAPDQPFSFCC